MDDRRDQKNAWVSVPQFGDWDQKHQMPDYSLDFSKIREMRKQNKRDVSRASLGNEEELVSQNNHQHDQIHHQQPHHTHHSPTVRMRTLISTFPLFSLITNFWPLAKLIVEKVTEQQTWALAIGANSCAEICPRILYVWGPKFGDSTMHSCLFFIMHGECPLFVWVCFLVHGFGKTYGSTQSS